MLHQAHIGELCFVVNEQDILDRTDMTAEEKVKKLNDMKVAQKEEVRQFDMSLVLQLDQKVSFTFNLRTMYCLTIYVILLKVADQQQTLEQAGVPGFFVTSSALDVKVQMYLLDFIFRLSKMDIPS